MGFLSFLTKRSSDKAKTKSQAPAVTVGAPPAHNSTVATSNGTSTSTGTKPTPPRGRSRISPIRISPPITRVPDSPAPAPAVSLFREEESVERPSTAPNGDSAPTVWANSTSRLRKNPLRGAPPVSFRLLRPTTANPGGRPVSLTGSTDSIAQVAQTVIGHSRSNSVSNSMRSDDRKGFKDLLDAQSEIRPADFRSRVKASGARDYGEDVADRNIGENGFNLESSPVQAFYAHVPKLPGQQEPAGSVNIADIRTRSLTSSSTTFNFAKKPPALRPLVPRVRAPEVTFSDADSPLLRRRQSLNIHMPSALGGTESDPSPKRMKGQRTSSNPMRPATSQADKPSWDLPTLSSIRLSSPVLADRPKTARPATAHSPIIPRDSVVLAKQKAGAPIGDYMLNDGLYTPYGNPLPGERSYPLRTPMRLHRGSVTTTNPASASPRKRHSLHTLQSSASFPNGDPAVDATPLAYPRSKHHQAIKKQSVISLPEVTIDFDVAASPTTPIGPARSHYIRSPFTIHEIPEPGPEFDGASSKCDSPELVPLRTRSIRGWSTSSATPTTSDTSSKLSRHTANTSIDLSQGAPSIIKVPSHASLDSGAAFSPHNAMPTNNNNNFNIDDYLSSDDDSIAEPRRPRAEGEEQLLFSESGYGMSGFQLPGLPDAPPKTGSPKQHQILQHARSSISLPPIYNHGSFGPAGGRRFILDTAADSDDSGEETPCNSPSPMRGLRGTKRLSAICSSPSPARHRRTYSHEVIEEERTGKVDVAAAVRLRKETKARKRASGIQLARPRKARSAVALGINVKEALVAPVDDEASYADVE
ncbi:hypothetical protein B0T16DRAFT_185688 [Cercophora newfieldiana]|uniref:Uncharacterized protein n=1 Tax=Cercophora newfieldiana TaxID=92897 RepID=A0AA40CNK7_9PEZI|nr:hypothetical protein B0T16DRAFT_185688 [Cercophora newfieldiana]